jgi:hypothetical protein
MTYSANQPAEKIYEARYLPNARIAVDGVLDEPAWDKANVERGFCFPWKKQNAPPTEFRALCDDESLYFAFRVHDEDIVLAEPFAGKMDVVHEDRVELFFARDEELKEYFCLEMDPHGRTLDYKAASYRKFDYPWSFPGVRVAGKIVKQGYVVEGAIRLESLAALGLPSLKAGGRIKVAILRAEFSHGKDGVVEDWISWVDPRTKTPDFHVPSAFGYLKLAK